jgi:orotate phosphoribosyltransferase-like protein
LDENIDKVRNLVQNDHCVSVGMIAEELNLNRETAVYFDGKFGHE